MEDQIDRGQIQEGMAPHQTDYSARIGVVLVTLIVVLEVAALSVSSEAGVQAAAVKGITVKEGPVDNISSKEVEVVGNKICLKQL